jgi:hypothetical protein
MTSPSMVPAAGRYAAGVIVVAGRMGSGGGGAVTARTVAERVAGAGSVVEIVAVVGGDTAGDRALFELRSAGVGHAAVLRSPATDLEPADVELALRYLPDIRAVVVVDEVPAVVAAAAAAAGWAAAGLIVVTGSAGGSVAAEEELGDRAIVLAAPAHDPDAAFAGFVAALAIRLADGETPADAWAGATAALGVEAVSGPSRS